MKTIFIPKEQRTTKDYIRWTTIVGFVTFMLYLTSIFYEEYYYAEQKQKEVKQVLRDTQTQAQQQHQDRMEKEKRAITENKQAQSKAEPSAEPKGGGAMPPPPVAQPSDTKIEIDAGIIKVIMDNESSWAAIYKMLVTILGTFFGIRLINFAFKKLDKVIA